MLAAAPWLAAVWALIYGPVAGLSLLGRLDPPWGPAAATPLGFLPGAVQGAVVLGLAVTVAAALAARGRRSGLALAASGVVIAAAVADVGSLQFLGYLPMLLLALVGVGPAVGHLDLAVLTSPAASLGHSIGGTAIAVTGVARWLRVRRASGRAVDPTRLVRWTPVAVAIAAIVPVCYAVTRIAWALGIPLGVRPAMIEELGSMRFAGLGLALFACAGAWLTTGLSATWGEAFWRWLPRVGGRPVPIGLAVVPALFVAGAVVSGGLSFWRILLGGHVGMLPGERADWAAYTPELLWPLWGLALAVAAVGYLARRVAPSADGAEDRSHA